MGSHEARPSRIATVALGCLLWCACDVAEVDSAASRDAADVSELAEVEVTQPSSVEQPIEGDGASDDLFPDLSGDDLVWVQVRLDTSVAAPETDCLTCPYCAGCRFDLVHRRLPDRQTTLLAAQAQATSRPRVHDGTVVWLDGSSVIHVRDVDSGESYQGSPQAWIGTTPVPFNGKVWWWGYDSSVGYGVVSFDYTRDVIQAEHRVSMLDPNLSTGSLASFARSQPFSIDAHGIVFATNDARALMRWAFRGEAEVLVQNEASGARLLRGLTRDDGRLVVLSDDGDARLTLDGHDLSTTPSRYVAPVVDGDRVLWLDFRDGGYAVFGAREAGRAGTSAPEIVRVSSEAAVIGAISSIGASDGRVVWSDHRSGRWRLMTRTW